MTEKKTMDQAIANLHESMAAGVALSPDAVRRIISVTNSHGELFDAASVILGWMRGLPLAYRPIAKFNRLQDAINGVREAHQMETAANG